MLKAYLSRMVNAVRERRAAEAGRSDPASETGAAPVSRARVVKKSDGVDYMADLLELIQLKPVRMYEVRSTVEPCVYVRHDVDHDLDVALRVAEVEARARWSATYFLLTPGAYDHAPRNYYGHIDGGRIVHDPALVDKCRRLVDLGHDLGFHNDAVALSLKTGRPPAEILAEETAFFARHGLPLRGTSAHGNPLARRLEFNNREIFRECVRAGREPGREIAYKGRSVRLHTLRLADYGFEYEAYSLPRDSRISESGGAWAGVVAGTRLPREEWKERFDLAAFRAAVARSSAANGVQAMSILMHPIHWSIR